MSESKAKTEAGANGAEEVADAEVVGEEGNGVVSTDLVPAPGRMEVIRPLDAEAVVESMEAHQKLLRALLDRSDYQQAEAGKKFVKKSGWRKIATGYGLNVAILSTNVERNEEGMAIRAEVVARATAPNGRSMDGDGYCSIEEKRFAEPLKNPDKAKKMKVENDLRATAATRATNRAISNLVGMGEVSAEEVDGEGAPPYGPAVEGKGVMRGSRSLTLLMGGDEELAESVWNEIKGELEYMPAAVTTALYLAARALHRAQGGESTDLDGPKVTADKPKPTEASITGPQKRKLMAQAKKADLADERTLKAIIRWTTGVESRDRIPKSRFNDLLDVLPNWQFVLEDIHKAAAGEGEGADRQEEASAIVARYLAPTEGEDS